MSNRRDFLKQLSTFLGLPLVGMPALASDLSQNKKELRELSSATNNKPLKISIYQTTDVHCQVHAHDEFFWENNQPVFRKTGGYAYLKTLFDTWRKANPLSFFIDTGDMFQGSELAAKTTGQALVPILNEMGYNLYLPGNWEVVYGKRNMQHLLGALNAPKVCANMYHDLGNGQKGELIFPPYYIWYVAGIKIGFLGYTDHLVPIRQSPNYSKGIIYTKPEENLKHYVQTLKDQEKCDFIIIVAHIGLSQQIALANNPDCEGVNYIFGGDTHERVREPIVCRYAKVVEPGAFGSFIGHLELTVQNKKIIEEKYELIEVKSPHIKPNIFIEKLITNAEVLFKKDLQEVIGYSTIPLYRYFVIENPIDTMILNALAWNFPDIDIVLSNGFRFCPPQATADHTGNFPITSAYLYDMFPVDSNAKTAKVTGQQLKNWLEKELNNVFAKDARERFGGWVVKFHGMKVKFFAFAEMGKRVQEISIQGKPLELDKTYTIAACERDGDPDDVLCRIKGVTEPRLLPKTLHQIMKEYLKHNSPVTPLPAKNAIALDAPATLLTQVTGVNYTFR
ncbi:MAG: bifunctional metallophosphatase/5'-nucleotidase [Microscillaceae bacterium]|nr:bifunctional metallophosphatase/5'-nucleotidase [Microscillaceae bacterium]MDW8461425.1 5'-nucleotidase C-terminal domain-containing protein [Cytophagales bacterium]